MCVLVIYCIFCIYCKQSSFTVFFFSCTFASELNCPRSMLFIYFPRLSTYFTFSKFLFTISSIFIYFLRLCWFTSSCVYIHFPRACLLFLLTISSVLFNIHVEFSIVLIYRSIKRTICSIDYRYSLVQLGPMIGNVSYFTVHIFVTVMSRIFSYSLSLFVSYFCLLFLLFQLL